MSRPFPFRSNSREPEHRKNGKIRAREVRLIDEDKQPLGVFPLGEALRLAQARGMDLIEVAPNAEPPVCRIMEYGKFKYEEAKKKGDLKARQAANLTKELQLSANIDPHDFQVKLGQAIEFLSDGMKVRIKLRFRGRQKAHKEYGFGVVARFIRETAAFGKPDTEPKLQDNRDLMVFLTPLPREQRGKKPPVPPATAGAAAPAGVAPKAPSKPAIATPAVSAAPSADSKVLIEPPAPAPASATPAPGETPG